MSCVAWCVVCRGVSMMCVGCELLRGVVCGDCCGWWWCVPRAVWCVLGGVMCVVMCVVCVCCCVSDVVCCVTPRVSGFSCGCVACCWVVWCAPWCVVLCVPLVCVCAHAVCCVVFRARVCVCVRGCCWCCGRVRMRAPSCCVPRWGPAWFGVVRCGSDVWYALRLVVCVCVLRALDVWCGVVWCVVRGVLRVLCCCCCCCCVLSVKLRVVWRVVV